jgi:hypothetical protein
MANLSNLRTLRSSENRTVNTFDNLKFSCTLSSRETPLKWTCDYCHSSSKIAISTMSTHFPSCQLAFRDLPSSTKPLKKSSNRVIFLVISACLHCLVEGDGPDIVRHST